MGFRLPSDIPEEAQGAALSAAKFYGKQKMVIKFGLAAWPEAPYRTTLIAMKGPLFVLVEAQGTLDFHPSLMDFANWLASQRHYVEFYIATTASAMSSVSVLDDMRKHGVGLLITDEDGGVTIFRKARNPGLVVTPDPTLTYGECKKDVRTALEKFNEIDRKDGLRDMCELVERETDKLLRRIGLKRWLKIPQQSIDEKDWSEQIDALASANVYKRRRKPIVNNGLKSDLHSFRNARNLLDHKVRGKRQEAKRQMQFADKMMQGTRLIAELVALQRRVS